MRDPYTSLPSPPLVIGSDYSKRPIPGQASMNLWAAGYDEPGVYEAERPDPTTEETPS